MHLEDYFVTLAPDDIRLRGHRIGIETILYEYIHRGRTAEQIAAEFDTLSLEEIYATLLYYHRNKQQIDAYLTAWLEHGARARAAQERDPSVQQSRARLRQAAAQAVIAGRERAGNVVDS
jgi:uncharacterized protein (DUF433 family)